MSYNNNSLTRKLTRVEKFCNRCGHIFPFTESNCKNNCHTFICLNCENEQYYYLSKVTFKVNNRNYHNPKCISN